MRMMYFIHKSHCKRMAGAARADFQVTTWEGCKEIDSKLMGGIYGQPFGVGGVLG